MGRPSVIAEGVRHQKQISTLTGITIVGMNKNIYLQIYCHIIDQFSQYLLQARVNFLSRTQTHLRACWDT